MKNTKETSAKKDALIVPAVGFDLSTLSGKDIKGKAEQALIAVSIRVAQINAEADDEKIEYKKLKKQLDETKVGKRMKQISANRLNNKKELSELNSGMKYLLKFFKDNGIEIDSKKIKALKS